jgi:hypothetical protein
LRSGPFRARRLVIHAGIARIHEPPEVKCQDLLRRVATLKSAHHRPDRLAHVVAHPLAGVVRAPFVLLLSSTLSLSDVTAIVLPAGFAGFQIRQ